MATPATQGKLCTSLQEMEIGDYIRCTYTATEANVAGEFSDLGGFVDTYETQQQQVDGEGNPVVDEEGNPVMETVTKQYEEIPIFAYVSAATIPIQGYFYFLKVDKGLLVADRRVQNFISAASLNVRNYLQGRKVGNALIRTLSQGEWTKYLTNGDLNGCITKQDVNVWHVNNYPTDYVCIPDGVYHYYHLVEYLSDFSHGNIKIAMNINGTSRDGSNHVSLRPAHNLTGYVSKYQSALNTSYYVVSAVYYNSISVYSNLLFRPALEYIDNPYSKTIFY